MHAATAKRIKSELQDVSKCEPNSDPKTACKKARERGAQAGRRYGGSGGNGGGFDGQAAPDTCQEGGPPLGMTPDPLVVPLSHRSGRWLSAPTRGANTAQ